MGHLTFEETGVSGVTVVQKSKLGDNRGHLSRMFCGRELADVGWVGEVAQINHTLTRKRGTVRGMHFQLYPHQETKIVQCLRGAVLDVAVDLRRGSPTFLKWTAVELSSENWRSLYIPEGCAHGFQTLTDDVEMLYFHSEYYAPGDERGVSATDPDMSIEWPLPIVEMSERDKELPSLNEVLGVDP